MKTKNVPSDSHLKRGRGDGCDVDELAVALPSETGLFTCFTFYSFDYI